MAELYHILAKKSIFCLFLAIIFAPHGAILAKTPNDPYFQQDLYRQINAESAWDKTTGSHQLVVAVIDTGADIFHPDLNDNIWKNTLEIEGNGQDDDHNGYADDYFGWNFVDDNNNVITAVNNAGDDHDTVSHGTIIAGLIGASGDNGRAGTGINWQVKIMPLRAINNEGTGSERDLVKAIDYAIEKKADIISMSFVTFDYLPAVRDALRRAYDRGIVIVSSAGNEGLSEMADMDRQAVYPICFDQGDKENWIIGVTSVDKNDRRSFFADYGSCVDIAAPGENIFSTERYAPAYGFTREFGGPWKGNSFATPIVAGAAALLKSVRPDWKADEIISALLANTDSIDAWNPMLIGKLGRGRLNLGRAVTAAYSDKPASADIAETNYDFTFDKNLIYRDGIPFAYLEESRILALEVADINHDGQREIAVLREGRGYYFLRVLTSDGDLWKEFSVGPSLAKNILSKRLEIVLYAGDWGKAAVASWDEKKKMTVIAVYSFDGDKLGQTAVKAKLSDWTAGQDEITTVRAGIKGKITEKWNWQGKRL